MYKIKGLKKYYLTILYTMKKAQLKNYEFNEKLGNYINEIMSILKIIPKAFTYIWYVMDRSEKIAVAECYTKMIQMEHKYKYEYEDLLHKFSFKSYISIYNQYKFKGLDELLEQLYDIKEQQRNIVCSLGKTALF